MVKGLSSHQKVLTCHRPSSNFSMKRVKSGSIGCLTLVRGQQWSAEIFQHKLLFFLPNTLDWDPVSPARQTLSQHNRTDPSVIYDTFRLINKVLQLVGFCSTTLGLVKNKDFCHLEYDLPLFKPANVLLWVMTCSSNCLVHWYTLEKLFKSNTSFGIFRPYSRAAVNELNNGCLGRKTHHKTRVRFGVFTEVVVSSLKRRIRILRKLQVLVQKEPTYLVAVVSNKL